MVITRWEIRFIRCCPWISHQNICNKPLQTMATWGWALSCPRVTFLDIITYRWYLIVVFTFSKVLQGALRYFETSIIGDPSQSPSLQAGTQPINTFRWNRLSSSHQELIIAACTIQTRIQYRYSLAFIWATLIFPIILLVCMFCAKVHCIWINTYN